MKIVGTDSVDVEVGLLAGLLDCSDCGGKLGPWGHGRRRMNRIGDDEIWRSPRRSRCRSCKATHMLLPGDVLVRRRDGVEVIGDALTMASLGSGFRPIAVRLGRPPETVRGWLRRFRSRAEAIRVHFTRWAVSLDSETFELVPTTSPLGDAVAAISAAGSAAVRKAIALTPWQFVSAVTISGLLCNTTCPWASP